MNAYERMIRAFEIFNSYPGEHVHNLAAEHDRLFAGPDPAEVSADHIAELNALGWHDDSGHESFYRWV